MFWLIFWLCIVIVTLIIELATVGLVSIWLTGGGAVALLVCVLGGPVWLQAVLFFAVSFALMYFTRPWAMKMINRRKISTNYEEIIGQEVKVIERVNNRDEKGKALYNGMEWTARSTDPDICFEQDEIALVESVSGVKLILKRR